MQQVVLQDVAARSGLLVELPAALDAQVLGHGDLHVVDARQFQSGSKMPLPKRKTIRLRTVSLPR